MEIFSLRFPDFLPKVVPEFNFFPPTAQEQYSPRPVLFEAYISYPCSNRRSKPNRPFSVRPQRFAEGGDYDDQELNELEAFLQEPTEEVNYRPFVAWAASHASLNRTHTHVLQQHV